MFRYLSLIFLTIISFSSIANEGEMKKYKGSGWELNIEDSWVVEDTDGLITIYNPQGVGALQVSSYSKDSIVTEYDLKELAQEHIDAGAKVDSYIQHDSKVLTLAFGVDGEFWQHWYIAINHQALFVSYNCDVSERSVEIDTIKKIVASISKT
jgi:hypothetical protein